MPLFDCHGTEVSSQYFSRRVDTLIDGLGLSKGDIGNQRNIKLCQPHLYSDVGSDTLQALFILMGNTSSFCKLSNRHRMNANLTWNDVHTRRCASKWINGCVYCVYVTCSGVGCWSTGAMRTTSSWSMLK